MGSSYSKPGAQAYEGVGRALARRLDGLRATSRQLQ